MCFAENISFNSHHNLVKRCGYFCLVDRKLRLKEIKGLA